MVVDFEQLLSNIEHAKNRSQLEQAFDIAMTFLNTSLNTDAISNADYSIKTQQINGAYHAQLIDYQQPIADFMKQVYQAAINEVSHDYH